MQLIDLILSKLGADDLSPCVRYTVLDDKSGYFQNVKKIAEFSPCQIVLIGVKCKFVVVGEYLTIDSFYGTDLIVRGKINRVEKCV